MSLPGLSATGGSVVVLVTTSKTTGFLASGGKTTGLAMLVDGVDDPVDACILADGLVHGVDKDDLEVLVGAVLVDPVRVEDAQVGAAATDTLLSSRLKRTLVLELVHTLVGGLACDEESVVCSIILLFLSLLIHHLFCRIFIRTVSGTLGHWSLATTAADSGTVDNVTLLSLVSKTAGLVGARRAGSAVDDVQLTELY